MSKKKDFRADFESVSNPAQAFISGERRASDSAKFQSTSAMAMKVQQQINDLQAKREANSNREHETRRLQLVMTPTLYDNIDYLAWRDHKKVAKFIKELLEKATSARQDELKEKENYNG